VIRFRSFKGATTSFNSYATFVQLEWAVFPYDPSLLAAVQATPQTISDALQTLQTIDATCVEGDGLKWFNWLYLQVTQAVEARVATGGFTDPAWLAQLYIRA
jgi:Family of unknown function (DUF5995)